MPMYNLIDYSEYYSKKKTKKNKNVCGNITKMIQTVTKKILNRLNLVLFRITFSVLLTDRRREGQKGPTSLKSATIMKLSTVLSYLKKIQKTYKLRDTPLEFY